MTDGPAIPPIESDELLYRRVLEDEYEPSQSPFPVFTAFRPNSNDVDGLSLYRARYRSPQSVAIGPKAKPNKKYFVAVIRAETIRTMGLTVATDDEVPPHEAESSPDHCIIPELHAAVRRTEEVSELASLLSASCLEVLGPFTASEPHA